MKQIKHAIVQFIEKGTYVGSDEETFANGLTKTDKDYVVISKKDWDYIQTQLFRLEVLEH